MLPAGRALPPPSMEYLEIECAKAHGGWPVWEELPASTRGRLLAHELHKNMREHYQHDILNPKDRGKVPPVWDEVRDKYFGGHAPPR